MKHIAGHRKLNLYVKVFDQDVHIHPNSPFFVVAIEDVYNIVVEHLLIILFELISKIIGNINVILER